jgi:hypothetical protein
MTEAHELGHTGPAMRIALVVIVALSLGLLGSAAGEGESRSKATLKLSRGMPLTLRGTHFLPNERVRVTVSSEMKRTKRVVANAAGAFVVSFQTAYDRCDGLLALAVGTGGSRAMLKMPQLGCPPSL